VQTFYNNFFILKQLNKFSKSRIPLTLVSTFFTLINDLILNILFLPFIISAVASNYPITKLFLFCGIMIAVRIVIESFFAWRDTIYIPKSDAKIAHGFQCQLYDKAQSVDLICYDDPQFYNNSVWVVNDIDKRAVNVLNSSFGWLGNMLMVVSVITMIVTLEPYLLIFSVLPVIVSFLFNKKINQYNYKYQEANILPERKLGYINKVFTSVLPAKELRLFPRISTPLISLLHKSVYVKKENIKKFGGKIAFSYSIVDISSIFLTSVAIFYLSYKALATQNIDAGMIIALSNSMWQISGRLELLVGFVNEMQKHSMYIENYKNFMAMESEIKQNETGKRAANKANSIKLKHVSFKYPNMEKYVLKDVNMEINSGEKVAIVGHNGAGKTTLIKLIMRLYLPQEGNIYLDGEKEEEYNLDSLRGRFGVIFQDFQLYAMTVGENVLMDEDCESEEKKTVIDAALKSSGLYDRIYKEKNNINTSVLKEYDEEGLILSGGQAQKLAIARIFAKDCGVVIMDEPSSALDPISEHEMHKNMLEAAKDKTVILISHRLWTTKDVDRIYYFENGEIVEEGSHEELMQHNGQYAKMFHIQADKY
jgi:ATP-binding cassette subfamily B protein